MRNKFSRYATTVKRARSLALPAAAVTHSDRNLPRGERGTFRKPRDDAGVPARAAPRSRGSEVEREGGEVGDRRRS